MKKIQKRANGTLRVSEHFDAEKEPSLTKQEFRDECDLNRIMKKYGVKNAFQMFQPKTGSYVDLTTAKSFEEAQNLIANAYSAFDSLPSKVRKRFSNNPQELLAFIHDSSNFEEGVSLGIFEKPKPKLEPQNEPKNEPAPKSNP